ncbi:MAG: M20 family metallopeptidase [Planctomycetota bacterium]|jgi:succinyl-diaminopimelate desuccinylase
MKELLKKLVQADTTLQKGELAAAKVICAEFGRSGIDSRIDSWDQNRANITARVKSSGAKKALLFACHLDVVPPGQASWKYPPFAAVESDDKIHGRGSVDMKGGTTAAVTAIRQIVDSGIKLKGDVIFFAAAGEEIDSCGAKRFVQNFSCTPELAGVIVPEPTDIEIITSHRGMFWLKVTTKGKTAHGSTPQLGINALTSMRILLDQLENYKIQYEPHELLGSCSMSINTIAAGKAVNVVPDQCDAEIDIRPLPGQNYHEIITDFEKIFVKLKQEDPKFDAEIRVVRDVPPLETNEHCDFVKDLCTIVGIDEIKTVGFATDGPCFVPLGAPVVVFGPGKPQLCHKPDEHIDIGDVKKITEHYKNIILKFLS